MEKKKYGQCVVCNDDAIGTNFGVSTCMPCKAFFRRNAFRFNTAEAICKYNGDCIITCNYRRGCNACRLMKCFRMGMQKSLILSDEQRKIRNKLVQENRLKRGQIPKQESIQGMQSSSLIRMTSNGIKILSPSEQIQLANIFNAYENTCIAVRNNQYQIFPLIIHTSLHKFLNEISNKFPTFIDYFKHIPEFARIPINDKIRLTKAHFGSMININEPLMYSITPTNLVATWSNVFGADITFRLLKRNQIIEEYTMDPILLKLVLIILVLSSSNSRDLNTFDLDDICDDSISIFLAQNIYVELLWNYILSRMTTYRDAVKFYNKLILCLLYIMNLDRNIDSYINTCKDEIQQMEPLIQTMWPNSNDNIPK